RGARAGPERRDQVLRQRLHRRGRRAGPRRQRRRGPRRQGRDGDPSDGRRALIDSTRLVVSRELRGQIVAHARESAPQECCGLLLGDEDVVRRVLRCRNVHPTPETRYVIDQAQVFEAFRHSRDFDRELVAIYHSHPRSPAYPSPTDRAEAQWPLAAYVLVSLRVATPEVFAYRISDGAVREIPIVEATA